MRTVSLLSRGGWAAVLFALASTGLASASVAVSTAAAGDTCHKPVVAGDVATVVCPYTGAAALWRVPKGVTSVTFDLYGAQGGSQADTARSVPGGLGAHVHSVQVVRPGQVLMIVAGGSPAPDSVAGGFNGGGPASGRTRPGSLAGGGGGGATDVRTGPGYTLADRVLVAGGGGGNGGNASVGGWAQGASGGTSGEQGCCGINGGGAGAYVRGGPAEQGGPILTMSRLRRPTLRPARPARWVWADKPRTAIWGATAPAVAAAVAAVAATTVAVAAAPPADASPRARNAPV